MTHEYSNAGRTPIYRVDGATGAKDLIYDPTDATQAGPYGCLLNYAETQEQTTIGVEFGKFSHLLDIDLDFQDILMGPQALAGGQGLGIFGTCRQGIGDCVAACGSNFVEGTLRAEAEAGERQDIPQISICHIYHGAQGYYRRPGGDGATTEGLAATLYGFDTKGRHVKRDSGGRYGGFVHESPFGSESLPGWPYKPNQYGTKGIAPDLEYIELGLKHTMGMGSEDSPTRLARIRNPEEGRAALMLGRGFFTGIPWVGSWGTVDRDGFVTNRASSGRGGHEILFCGCIRRPAVSGYSGSNSRARQLAEGNDFWWDLGNTWGDNFGVQGHVLVPESQVVDAGVFREAYTAKFAKGWDTPLSHDWEGAAGA